MANANPPKKNQAFTTNVALEDFNNPGKFKVNPTLAAGDVTIVKDHGTGAPSNVTTLPTVLNASWPNLKLDLSATEMNADNVLVLFKDQTDPPEWCEKLISINTTA